MLAALCISPRGGGLILTSLNPAQARQGVDSDVPIDHELVAQLLRESHFDTARLSIREVNRLVTMLEQRQDFSFVRMEFGVPNIPPPPLVAEALHAAIDQGVHGRYPAFDGIPELKAAGARFVEAFFGLSVTPACVIPTCGAMQGGFIAQALAGNLRSDAKTILFLDPSFPVSKLQTRFLGLAAEGIDLYDHRGEKLLAALAERLAHGGVGGLLWSSPNNPAWVCLTDEELAGIARLCDEHDVIAIEDQAYMGMDFRTDYSQPFAEPYIPTVARHGRNWVLLPSASKAFSFPGPRTSIAVLSPHLLEREFEGLEALCGTTRFSHAFAHGGLYVTTSGTSHVAQHGLAAMLDAACDGDLDFVAHTRPYGERAREVKRLLLAHGFSLVYDNDLGEPVGDGFYITAAYPGFTGPELLLELLHYGISAITLKSTGSSREEGLRLCVSFVTPEQYPVLEHRLARFQEDHP